MNAPTEEPENTPHLRWSSLEQSARAYYRATPMERIRIIKSRVPAKFVTVMSLRMKIPREKLYSSLNLARATIDRKVRKEELLSQDESERVLGVARLVGQAETIVKESGNAEGFNPSEWVAGWLQHPHAALGGKSPAELMDTGDGRELVADLLARQQSGAYT